MPVQYFDEAASNTFIGREADDGVKSLVQRHIQPPIGPLAGDEGKPITAPPEPGVATSQLVVSSHTINTVSNRTCISSRSNSQEQQRANTELPESSLTRTEDLSHSTATKRRAMESITEPSTKRIRRAKMETSTETIEAASTVLGHGAYTTTARKFVYQQDSSVFVGQSVSKTPQTMEYFEQRKRELEEESYHRITDGSAVIETTDGYGLVMFVKGGMYTNKPGEERQLREKSEAAFKAFTKAYPPEIPKKADYRHVIALENEKMEWQSKGLPWGRLHLTPWHENGHPKEPLTLSRDASKINATQMDALKAFMRDTAWEHDQGSKWLKALDEEAWLRMNKWYQDLQAAGKLEHLYQGPNGIYSGFVPISNLAVQPHRDPKDARGSWTQTNAWGDYEGAWAVFPQLRSMIFQEPGDVLWCRSYYLEHWVTPILKGQRFCNTRFNKEDVVNPKPQIYVCPVPECGNTVGVVTSLRDHIGKYHFQLSDAEVEQITSSMAAHGSCFNENEARSVAGMLTRRMFLHDKKQRKQEKKVMLDNTCTSAEGVSWMES